MAHVKPLENGLENQPAVSRCGLLALCPVEIPRAVASATTHDRTGLPTRSMPLPPCAFAVFPPLQGPLEAPLPERRGGTPHQAPVHSRPGGVCLPLHSHETPKRKAAGKKCHAASTHAVSATSPQFLVKPICFTKRHPPAQCLPAVDQRRPARHSGHCAECG